MPDSRTRITKRDHKTIAEFVADEFTRRRKNPRRVDLEKQWKEVDRQIAMIPKPRVQQSGDPKENWMSEIEMPAQAAALELDIADAVRLVFPPSTDWYSVFARLDDDYLKAESSPVIVEQVLPMELPLDPEPMLNLTIHSAMDYLHKLTMWRETWKALLTEAVKYGTFCGRWQSVEQAVRGGDYRGISGRKLPTLLPVSIKNHYPDDSAQVVLQEGMSIEPSMIRHFWQKNEDLRRASGSGWVGEELKRLEDGKGSGEKKNHTEIVEIEGDIWVPRSQGGYYVENQRILVALTDGPKVIRVRTSDLPFRSYITGVYQKDDIDSPYGTSPLLKGRPLQEMISEAANRTSDSAVLNTEPPIVYDEQDTTLAGHGGPAIAPGEKYAADNPDAIRTLQVGDPSALFALLQGLLAQHENLTAQNEPRRGADPTSHTTAFAADVATSRSVLRLENFVNGVEESALTTALYQEYYLLRQMGSTMWTPINSRGVQGFVEIRPKQLPEQAEFVVHGSRGVLNKREKRENMTNLTTLMANLTPLLAQMQPDAIPNFQELLREVFLQFGIDDPKRFDGRGAGASGQPPAATGVQGDPSAIAQLLPDTGTG